MYVQFTHWSIVGLNSNVLAYVIHIYTRGLVFKSWILIRNGKLEFLQVIFIDFRIILWTKNCSTKCLYIRTRFYKFIKTSKRTAAHKKITKRRTYTSDLTPSIRNEKGGEKIENQCGNIFHFHTQMSYKVCHIVTLGCWIVCCVQYTNPLVYTLLSATQFRTRQRWK